MSVSSTDRTCLRTIPSKGGKSGELSKITSEKFVTCGSMSESLFEAHLCGRQIKKSEIPSKSSQCATASSESALRESITLGTLIHQEIERYSLK